MFSVTIEVLSVVFFLGAHRKTAGEGYDFSFHSGLQHVQGTVDVTVPEVFYNVQLTININGYCLVLPGHQASSLWRELETTQTLPHKEFCFIAVPQCNKFSHSLTPTCYIRSI